MPRRTTEPMPLLPFLQALETCAPQMRWSLDGVAVRGTTRSGAVVCPVTAVVLARCHILRSFALAVTAGWLHLRLSWRDAHAVVLAADALAGHDPVLRQALLAAVGLASAQGEPRTHGRPVPDMTR